MGTLTWGHDALELTFSTDDDAPVSLVSAAARDAHVAGGAPVGLAQVLTADSGHAPASAGLGLTRLGSLLRYVDHQATSDAGWHRLLVTMEADGLRVDARVESPDGVAAVRSRLTVTAVDRPVVLRSVSSWSGPLGVTDGGEGWSLASADSDWLAESRWRARPLRGGLFPDIAATLTGHSPRGEVSLVSTGTWSSGRHAPVAAAAGPGACWLWQVEHNGAWRMEVRELAGDFAVALSGPTDLDHAWTLPLAVGESFTTVPVTLALAADLDGAAAAMTRFRRAARRPHPDHDRPAVCFNDYMNTLGGDPTTEKLLPLIDAAAGVGAEVFVVDAGWYDDSGHWWDGVGEWRPSRTRFPGGLGEVLDRIRAHDMTPGLWLEPEVVGVRSPVADRLPDSAFLQRGGQRIVEHDRYHLDLRHPAARGHLDEVVDRLVGEFGVGYFKLDYNINPGPGTDVDAPSVGHGLLEHNRAHLAWLDGVADRHPGLILENCGSGAMRADFALLSRLQLQSTSDQQEPLLYPPIAAAAPMQMLPEQSANWAYPQPGMSAEEAAFCLVTGLVGRFYLSGHLNRMTPAELGLVREAVGVARLLRDVLPEAVPSWPLGLPGWTDRVVAVALATERETILAVWRRDGAGDTALPLAGLRGRGCAVEQLFPGTLAAWRTRWDREAGVLTVGADEPGTARLFRLTTEA